MCGIGGVYDAAGADLATVKRMLDTIAHRGPDDEGYYVNGPIGLGNRRLSIIDLDAGRQPISNEDETLWIVYNGEIYNYQALRQELEAKGHRFQTHSDTEVIIHLFEEVGPRCVERLNGMFAFAIWDTRSQTLFMARDRLGQKPLFYRHGPGHFHFASEAKALVAIDDRAPAIDMMSVHHYLSLRFIPPPSTMFANIRKLPPGHTLTYRNGDVRIARYWELSFTDKLTRSENELVEGLDEHLHRAVDRHLVSDVPVGAFLSGGMDSSMIVALMAAQQTAEFKTFAIGVGAQDFDELPYARQVAEHVGSCHVEERVEADLVALLPRIVWHLDEPSDPIAACMFHAAQLASRHVKVVLGGDGGDELFAGFDRYLGVGYVAPYAHVPALLRQRLIGPLLAALPDSYAYKNMIQQLRWVHEVGQAPNAAERYAAATAFFRFNREEKQALFSSALWREVGAARSHDVLARPYNNGHAIDPLDRMLYTDYVTRLPEHSLMLNDRMTMAHGLEARSPFLDHELVEFLAAFPADLKIRKRELKYVLRRLGQRYLPPSIVQRDKQGFMFPVAYWMKTELATLVERTLLDGVFVQSGRFRRDAVQRLITDHQSSRRDNHVRLWMLLNLEVWHQLYVEGRAIDEVAASLRRHL